MAKSVYRKILVIFIAVLAAVFAFSFGRNFKAYAENESAEEQSAAQRVEEICEEVEDLYDFLESKGILLDKDNELLNLVKTDVLIKIENGENVENLLSGNIGLNGIKGIAELAKQFYSENLAGYNPVAGADVYVKGFAIANFKDFNYDKSKAQEYYDNFGKSEQTDKYKAEKDAIEAIYNSYLQHEDKDYVRYVKSKLRNIDRDYRDAIAALDECKSNAEANRIVTDFNAKFNAVHTYFEYLRYERVDADYETFKAAYNNKNRSLQVKLNYAFTAMETCEYAIGVYTAALAENENNGEAKIMASAVLGTYKDKLCLEAIDVVADKRAPDYGPSAAATISANKKLAKNLIKSIQTNGKIANTYKYYKSSDEYLVNKSSGYVNVESGSDVVQAFDDSYVDRSALRDTAKGENSSVPTARATSITKDIKGFRVTITSYESDGVTEKKEFDIKTTKIEVREGTTPSIKRNINTILGGKNLLQKIANSVSEKDNLAEELKGKHLHYYFTIKIYESDVEREDFNGIYKVEIKILGDNTAAEFKDNLNVINYYHTQINGAIAKDKITMDGNVIMFKTDNFSQFAVVSNINWVDIALWAVIGLVVFIAILWLIVLIIYLVKNRKFKIIFNANGGEPTTYLKVKLNEKFSYPANPTREGYVFMGWYTNCELETRFASTELLQKQHIAVWAKWITEEEYEALKAEEAAKAEAAKAEEAAKQSVENEKLVAATAVEAKEECESQVELIFGTVKAEALSYVKSDDLKYGLDAEKTILRLAVSGDAVELEVDLDEEELKAKGYNVIKGETLTSKLIIDSEEEALELVEEVMAENGFIKGEPKEADGDVSVFEFKVCTERVAETAEELLNVLRVKASSYVLAEGEIKNEIPLVKMFVMQGKLSVYLNFEAEGLHECDDALKAEGFKSFTLVHNADEAKAVAGFIREMMKANGLTIALSQKSVESGEEGKGFNYTLGK